MNASNCLLVQVDVQPDISGKALRAVIDKKLNDAGVSCDALPLKFEYKVKEACAERIFGNKAQWYNDLRSWCSLYSEADDQNIALVDATEKSHYVRSFITPGVCRRLFGK
jgi:hypothetical protein